MGDTNNSFDAKAKNIFMLSTDINVKGTVVGQIDIFTFLNAGISTAENIQEGASAEEFVADAVVDVIKIEGVSLRDYMKKGIKDGLTYITDGVADIWDKACEWGSDLLCSTIGYFI